MQRRRHFTHVVGSDVAVVHRRGGLGIDASAAYAVVGRCLHQRGESVRVVDVLCKASRMVDLVEKTHVRELRDTYPWPAESAHRHSASTHRVVHGGRGTREQAWPRRLVAA